MLAQRGGYRGRWAWMADRLVLALALGLLLYAAVSLL
jgi:hypothetical protein